MALYKIQLEEKELTLYQIKELLKLLLAKLDLEFDEDEVEKIKGTIKKHFIKQ